MLIAMGASHNIIRVLSKLGVCSRKQAVDYVRAGRIRVNGRVVMDPGFPANVGDKILVDGKPPAKKENTCLLFNKPAGCVTTRSDELGRKTVYDYLGDAGGWLFPVGRLDLDSEGLLVFTNDTALGNKLTDPNYKVPRTYEVTLDGLITPENAAAIRAGGIDIGRDEKTGPAAVSELREDGGCHIMKLTLTEGKNREIRRMFEALNRKVVRLVRLRFGPFSLGDIPSGKWRSVPVPKI